MSKHGTRVLAATLVAVVATAASAEAKPSRLWYRVGVSFSEKTEEKTESATYTTSSTWAVESDGAVILSIVCVGRRTFILLADKPCAKAYRRVHWRTFARNDLAFGATVSGIWERYFVTVVDQGHLNPVPEAGGFVQCGGQTLSNQIQIPPRFGGYLATDSLVRTGVALQLEASVRMPGESLSQSSGYSCAHTGFDGQLLSTDVFEGVSGPVAVTTAPLYLPPEEQMKLTVQRVSGHLGRSFSINRTFTNPPTLFRTREAKVSVSFRLCPRGGRAVRRC